MRCSCRVCGTYMVQVEHGLESGCKCPDCGNECHDCMGSAQPPMSVEQLRERMEFIALTGQAEQIECDSYIGTTFTNKE